MFIKKTTLSTILSILFLIFGVGLQLCMLFFSESKLSGGFFLKGNNYEYCEKFASSYSEITKRYDVHLSIENGYLIGVEKDLKTPIVTRLKNDDGVCVFDFRITSFNRNDLLTYYERHVPGTYRYGDESTRPVSGFLIGSESYISVIFDPDSALFKTDCLKKIECSIFSASNIDFDSAFIDEELSDNYHHYLNSLFVSGYNGYKSEVVSSNFIIDLKNVILITAFETAFCFLLFIFYKKQKETLFVSALSFLLTSIIISIVYYFISFLYLITHISVFVLLDVVFMVLFKGKENEENKRAIE